MGVELIIRNKKIVALQLIPFKTNNKVTGYHPYFLNSSEARLLFDIILPPEINTKFVGSSVILDL